MVATFPGVNYLVAEDMHLSVILLAVFSLYT